MGGEQYAKNRTENGATGRTWHEFLRGRGTNHGLQKNAGSVRMAVTLSGFCIIVK